MKIVGVEAPLAPADQVGRELEGKAGSVGIRVLVFELLHGPWDRRRIMKLGQDLLGACQPVQASRDLTEVDQLRERQIVYEVEQHLDFVDASNNLVLLCLCLVHSTLFCVKGV